MNRISGEGEGHEGERTTIAPAPVSLPRPATRAASNLGNRVMLLSWPPPEQRFESFIHALVTFAVWRSSPALHCLDRDGT